MPVERGRGAVNEISVPPIIPRSARISVTAHEDGGGEPGKLPEGNVEEHLS